MLSGFWIAEKGLLFNIEPLLFLLESRDAQSPLKILSLGPAGPLQFLEVKVFPNQLNYVRISFCRTTSVPILERDTYKDHFYLSAAFSCLTSNKNLNRNVMKSVKLVRGCSCIVVL